MDRKPQPNTYYRNLAMAAIAGQSGCSTVIIVFAALFAGLFINSRLHTQPVFTLGLVLLSVPLGLFVMVRMVLSATAQIRTSSTPSKPDLSPPKEKRP